MEWTEAIRKAVAYIESHIMEDITMYEVAEHINISPFYFHKGFSILCGYSIAEYIRNRRMALAGEEWITRDITVMELAIKYGYDSPDSFTRAFTRFHGHTPLTVRRNKTMIKTFAPLKLTISLKGGTVKNEFFTNEFIRCKYCACAQIRMCIKNRGLLWSTELSKKKRFPF